MGTIKKISAIAILCMLTLSGCAYEDTAKEAISEEASESATESPEVQFASDGSIMTVHYIDVGQGDSEFLELPNGETMLIDAGPQSASHEVVNYISDLGYTSIDYVIATHPHEDHIGGLPAVFEAFDIQSIYMPNATNNTKIFGKLLDAIEAEGIQITETVAGMDIVSFEDFEILSLAPSGEKQSNLNNYSIVLKATYGNQSFLFLADAEHEEIEEITGDMQANVLKVGHHGSDTSTSVYLLNAVQPQCAIISCSEGNSYGHPHQQTLDLLSRFSCEIFRTDLDGTIIFETDGEELRKVS